MTPKLSELRRGPRQGNSDSMCPHNSLAHAQTQVYPPPTNELNYQHANTFTHANPCTHIPDHVCHRTESLALDDVGRELWDATASISGPDGAKFNLDVIYTTATPGGLEGRDHYLPTAGSLSREGGSVS